MDDEEFGRAWAKQTGRAPLIQVYGGTTFWVWSASDPKHPHYDDLAIQCFHAVRVSASAHLSEAEAYAALGASVRAVLRWVPPLAEKRKATTRQRSRRG